MRSTWLSIVAAWASSFLACALIAQDQPERNGLPQIPIEVSEPAAPVGKIDDLDLRKYRSEVLASLALENSKLGNHQSAVRLQHWAVANGGGEAGLYNLACFYGLAENVDASIYWLQQAAHKEGVDGAWAAKDPDLKLVRQDPRWPKIAEFLAACNEYWAKADVFETRLVLPAGYDGDKPLPLMIGLHGMGGRAKSFVDEDLQEFADGLAIAFLAVSGTQPKGPTSFHWSEDPERDLAQIDRALKEVADQLTIDPQRVGLFGFSQGGMMAVEIAARHPERFAGALSLSPGGNNEAKLSAVKPTDQHKRQGYVMIYGGKEAPGNVAMAKAYVRETERLGARVMDTPYPDKSTHSYPLDFYARLPKWIKQIYGD